MTFKLIGNQKNMSYYFLYIKFNWIDNNSYYYACGEMSSETHCWQVSNLYSLLEGNLVVLNIILKKTTDPAITLLQK